MQSKTAPPTAITFSKTVLTPCFHLTIHSLHSQS
uniref:Uncharacterized protein n=1 Tax=Arundo donax TaxID=35708 RepID=A0A0A9AKH2_ARUDO